MSYNSKYFDRKPGSLENAVLEALGGQINENKYYEYQFKNKNDAMAAKKMLDAVQLMSFDINDDNISNGELMVDAGKKNMSKYHKQIMQKFKPKVMTQEKLDPVGKEDGDIDNDGDKDASDKYLAKRRKAVSKAIKGEEVKYPHMMYDPKTGKEVTAKTPEDHEKYAKMGYTHDKPKMEAYEMGTKEYADHTKKITPGQTTEDWNKQVDMMQEKNNSMRSILADMWGMDEGKNPFEKKEEKKSSKKEDKTMTGKPATKVSVDPDMNEKKK